MNLGLVLRYMVKYTKPLGESGKRNFFVALEPFVSLRETDWGGSSGLRQNRLAAGVAWKLSDKTTIEAGYMNAYVWRDSGEDSMNHLGAVNFKKRF